MGISNYNLTFKVLNPWYRWWSALSSRNSAIFLSLTWHECFQQWKTGTKRTYVQFSRIGEGKFWSSLGFKSPRKELTPNRVILSPLFFLFRVVHSSVFFVMISVPYLNYYTLPFTECISRLKIVQIQQNIPC